jgi:hypothetical protein
MAQLEGLSLATGNGRNERLMSEVPGFRICGHDHPKLPISPRGSDIGAAVRQWQALIRAWSVDPRTDPEKILRFEPAQEPDVDDIVYAEKTDLERQIVDLEFSTKEKV